MLGFCCFRGKILFSEYNCLEVFYFPGSLNTKPPSNPNWNIVE